MPFVFFFMFFVAQFLGATTINNGRSTIEGDYLKWTGSWAEAPQWGASGVGNSETVTQGVGTGNIGIFTGQWMPKTLTDPWLSPSGSQGSGTGGQTTGTGGRFVNSNGHGSMVWIQNPKPGVQDDPWKDFVQNWNGSNWGWGPPLNHVPNPDLTLPGPGGSTGSDPTPPYHGGDVPEPEQVWLFALSGLLLVGCRYIKAPN